MDFLADAPVSSSGAGATTPATSTGDDLPEENRTMARGETETLRFTLAVGTDARDWSEIWYTAKVAISDPDAKAVFQKKKSNNGIVVDPQGIGAFNVLQVVIQNADTATLGPYPYDLPHSLWALRTTGDMQPVFKGTLTVLPTSKDP